MHLFSPKKVINQQVEMRHKYLGKTSRAAMQEKTPGYI
jgi:hypothetical protein